jgi:hypothetical protein
MHRSLRRIICFCIVPHEFKSRTVTVASVVIIFSSTSYTLRVSCKIDGFQSKDIYCLSNIMNNNKTECEPYRYSFRLALNNFFNSQSLLTYPFIPTPISLYPNLSRLFIFHSPSVNLCIFALHFYPTISFRFSESKI